MEPQLLSDKDQFPDEEIIFSHIGKSKKLWCSFFDYLKKTYPDMIPEWRYYNDGKSWLMKVTRKTKTVCWVSVIKNAFRMTFYLPSKAEDMVKSSPLPDELKGQFNTTGKFHGITIVFKNKKDLEYAKMLVEMKLSIK